MKIDRPIKWDPAKEEIIGDSEANALLTPKMREPWTVDLAGTMGVEVGKTAYFDGLRQMKKVFGMMLIVFLLPTTQQLMARFGAALETYPGEVPEWRRQWMLWRPNRKWALAASAMAVVALFHLVRFSEFLYYQF